MTTTLLVAAAVAVPSLTALAQEPPGDTTTTTAPTATTTTTTAATTTTTAPPTTPPATVAAPTTAAPTTTRPTTPPTTTPPTTVPRPTTTAPKPPARPAACTINQPLSFGARGAAVRCLQQAINRDRASDIPVDSIYGAATVNAVRDFQRAVGLPVTGAVDAATAQRYRIWSGAAVPAPRPAPPGSCTISQPLSFGARGAAVRCLQLAINRDRASDIAVDSTYGSSTVNAVRDFQRAVGLPATGAVDAATAQRYRIWAAGGAPRPAPAPAPTGPCTITQQLSAGMSNSAVRCLQLAINRDRARDIAVTGTFDNATHTAVVDFQRAVGLPATGTVDAATAQRYGIKGPGKFTVPPAPAPGAFGLPPNSGTGRRVVYSRSQQRVWAVEADGRVVKTHLVSGRTREPYAGTYSVYSRSLHTYSTADPTIKWRYMVRFAYGPSGGRIGFHEIPNRYGVPLQSERQLGQPLSGGCVRQSTADAVWMWNWAGVGTKVVVL